MDGQQLGFDQGSVVGSERGNMGCIMGSEDELRVVLSGGMASQAQDTNPMKDFFREERDFFFVLGLGP